MIDPYDTLERGVSESGFHTTRMPLPGLGGDRLVCAARATAEGLTGTSFWIAKREHDWLVGTWDGNIYRIADNERVLELCIEWLRQPGDGLLLTDQLRQKYDLVEVHDL